MSPTFHCASCSMRPRANLTLRGRMLWRPECLYEVSSAAAKSVTPSVLERSRAAAHGLVVIEGKKRRRKGPTASESELLRAYHAVAGGVDHPTHAIINGVEYIDGETPRRLP